MDNNERLEQMSRDSKERKRLELIERNKLNTWQEREEHRLKCKEQKRIDNVNKFKQERQEEFAKIREYKNAIKLSKIKLEQKYNDLNIKEKRKIKTDYVNDYLKSHPCVDCGETDLLVLEFDHVNGVKRKSVALMRSVPYSLQTLIDEINKCEIRCANCHKRKTYKQMGFTNKG